MTDAALREALHRAGYIADEGLATTLWLAGELQRPLLLEGDAGVGKTALALAMASAQSRRLVRLQCHEGLDLSQAAYEWNYGNAPKPDPSFTWWCSKSHLNFKSKEPTGAREAGAPGQLVPERWQITMPR